MIQGLHQTLMVHHPCGDLSHLVHRDDVSKAYAEVLADDLVHTDLGLVDGVISEHNADGVLALLALGWSSAGSRREGCVIRPYNEEFALDLKQLH